MGADRAARARRGRLAKKLGLVIDLRPDLNEEEVPHFPLTLPARGSIEYLRFSVPLLSALPSPLYLFLQWVPGNRV